MFPFGERKSFGYQELKSYLDKSHGRHHACALVGLNCTGDVQCDEVSPCPRDSEMDPETEQCICSKNHCLPPPRCQYKSNLVLIHNATGVPGDCCSIYECTSPKELDCTDYVCPVEDIQCPNDSSPLPRRQVEGQCCSIPQGCECLPGPCPVPVCPEGREFKVRMAGNGEPGSCCPAYECGPRLNKSNSCIYNDKEVSEGTKWERNHCSECTCIAGKVHCTRTVTCPPLRSDCMRSSTPAGQCCPVCIQYNDTEDSQSKIGGCKSGAGVIYENGVSWEEDDCTTCICLDGNKKCQAAMCHHNGTSIVVVNLNCPSVTKCDLECKNGYALDEQNCFTCKCKDECPLECPDGFVRDENGEEKCECLDQSTCPSMDNCTKKCKHGYKTNKQGCKLCKCDHCKSLAHCTKRCPHGFQTNSKGCSICKCKPSSAIEESAGKDIFNICDADGDNPRDDGEAWYDGCRQCYCYGGKEMCALISCPKLDCPDAIVTKNSCCPVCSGQQAKFGMHVVCYGPGGLKMEGEKWTEGCAECMCHNGRVMCYKEMCPPALCTSPIPPQAGKCCPTCPQELPLPLTNDISCGPERPAGSSWRQDNCVSCICINGVADCYTEICNQIDITCKNPLQVKNQCCPTCFADSFHDPNVCREGNFTFNLGDEWEPEKCKRCTCGPGPTILCTQTLCENSCSSSNVCCPKCKDHDGIGSKLIFYVLSTLMIGCFGAIIFLLSKRCCQRRHQLKICQAVPTNYHQYKNVPSYDNQTPSPQKSPV